MSIPTFTLGYPPDGSSLGETKPVIRDNLDGTFMTLGIDHVDNNGNPGSNPAGYHTVIHQVTQSGNPAAIAGVNQIYSKIATIPSGDTQLFTRTGGGGISQLTGSLSSANGYVWCAGILIQWGTKTGIIQGSGETSTPVSFPVTFPTNLFTVIVSSNLTGISGGAWSVASTGSSSAGFQIITRGSAALTQVYWIAIGN